MRHPHTTPSCKTRKSLQSHRSCGWRNKAEEEQQHFTVRNGRWHVFNTEGWGPEGCKEVTKAPWCSLRFQSWLEGVIDGWSGRRGTASTTQKQVDLLLLILFLILGRKHHILSSFCYLSSWAPWCSWAGRQRCQRKTPAPEAGVWAQRRRRCRSPWRWQRRGLSWIWTSPRAPARRCQWWAGTGSKARPGTPSSF